MDSDQVTEPVQSDEGQGGGDPPYAEYLERIPEEARGAAEEAFKDWDRNTNAKFQEHAEYRKGWEQTGITPEQAGELTQFAQLFQDPQQAQQWWEGYAQANNLTPQEAAQAQQEAEQGWEGTGIDELLSNKLGPLEQRLEQFSQWQEQQDYQARYAEAERQVEAQMSELAEKHPDEFNREAVEKFVNNYVESDPENAVMRAWGDYQALRNQIEKDYAQGKVDQPEPAESGGMADGSPPEFPKDFKAARGVAMTILEQQRKAAA